MTYILITLWRWNECNITRTHTRAPLRWLPSGFPVRAPLKSLTLSRLDRPAEALEHSSSARARAARDATPSELPAARTLPHMHPHLRIWRSVSLLVCLCGVCLLRARVRSA